MTIGSDCETAAPVAGSLLAIGEVSGAFTMRQAMCPFSLIAASISVVTDPYSVDLSLFELSDID